MSARGVYAIIHIPTGAAYIGSSVHVTNRYTWHRVMLRSGEHTSRELQELWDKIKEPEWVFVLVVFCRNKEIRLREIEVMQTWPGKLLNERLPGYKLSDDLRERLSRGRIRYLATPGAREKLSKQAKEQHRQGRFRRKS